MMTLVQDPVATSRESQPTQPRFMISPGYMQGVTFAHDEATPEKTIKVMMVNLLDKAKWADLGENQRVVMDNRRLTYMKIDLSNNKVVEIGMHILTCKKVEEWGATEVIWDSGGVLTPKIVAMNDTSYARMQKSHLSLLS